MRLLRAALVLLVALALQAGLGRLWPAGHRFVDLMMLPVIWYAVVRSQRSAMLMGCAAGLLQDAWFEGAVFGLNGFRKTILGWTLGGLGSRFDLNSPAGRFASGVVVSLVDTGLDQGLRRLLNLEPTVPALMEIVVRALVTGLLVFWAFAMVERSRDSKPMRRLV